VLVHVAAEIIALVAVVTAVTGLSRQLPVPAPLVLTAFGLLGSFIPGVDIRLAPDLVLIGFLPPLLYGASITTSLVDFRRYRRPIGLLSVGLVIATAAVVALVVWWLLPVPLAAAFAIGAVVAPPDAVAATAIAKRVGMPRRMTTVLQGESLVNDATALVLLRSAVGAMSGTVLWWQVGLDFAVTAVGGLAVGLVVALVTGKIRYHVDDEATDTAISFLTPFIAYLVAEEFDFSGVLAVVIAGLTLGHKSHVVQSASSRVFERTNWRTVEFLLENTVFLLIGLQVRSVVAAVGESDLSPGRIALACAVVTLTVLGVRPLWVFPATYLPRLLPGVREREPTRPPWTYAVGVSWAGMRGVVTLAAAFTLPVDTAEREVLILIALLVVGATLILQGATLPWVLRRLHLHGPDPAEDALQAAAIQQRATAVGIDRLSALVGDGDGEEVVARVRDRSLERANAMWERLGGDDETPFQAYARLRIAMIDAERVELIRLRDEGSAPDDVLRGVIEALDVEETVLALGRVRSMVERDTALLPPGQPVGCEHLQAATSTPQPTTPDGCEECLDQGTTWVHLRLCMLCGHVGCCNSSQFQHADGHFRESGHAVMRSFEPGEAWRWCYVDEQLG
jgi:CPA1 family monovalent cation:H+ antiporter